MHRLDPSSKMLACHIYAAIRSRLLDCFVKDVYGSFGNFKLRVSLKFHPTSSRHLRLHGVRPAWRQDRLPIFRTTAVAAGTCPALFGRAHRGAERTGAAKSSKLGRSCMPARAATSIQLEPLPANLAKVTPQNYFTEGSLRLRKAILSTAGSHELLHTTSGCSETTHSSSSPKNT